MFKIMFKQNICRSIQRALPDYATRRLSSRECDTIERHLAVCPTCATIHHELRQAVTLANEAKSAPLPASLSGWNELRSQIERQETPAFAPTRSRLPLFAGLTTACALAGLLLWAMNHKSSQQQMSIYAKSGQDHSAKTRGDHMPVLVQKEKIKKQPLPAQEIQTGVTNRPAQERMTANAGGIPQKRTEPKVIEPQAIERQITRTLIAEVKHPTVVAQTDDLTYLNPDPAKSIEQWTHRSNNEIHRLDAALQQEVKGTDNFVTVPLPQIVGQGDAGIRSAVALQLKEAQTVDTRLVREIAIKMKGVSFADLCSYLTQQTGVRVTANRSVADDKVTIFCHPRALRVVMRRIVEHFGFTWIRKGAEGAYEYELVQPMRSQLLEEGLREKDQEEMLLAIDRSMERLRRYAGIPLDQINAQMAHATPGAAGDLFQLQMGGLVPMNMFFGLSQDDLDLLRTGKPLSVDLMGRGADLFPPDLIQGISHSFDEVYTRERAHGGIGAAPTQPQLTASLRLDRSKPGEISLKGNLYDGRTGLEPTLALAKSPAYQIKNAQTNAALATDPDLQQTVTILPRASCRLVKTPYPDTEAIYDQPGDKVTSGDVLETIFQTSGMDVMGDFFSHLYDPATETIQNRRLFDALNLIGDKSGLRWIKTGSGKSAWIEFRTGAFYYDRHQEIPNRLLERWKALRDKQGMLSLDDLTEIAQLPDAQLDSVWMAQGAVALHGLAEWQFARNAQLRPHWRFLAGLPDTQRQAVWSPAGLSFGALSPEMQNEFLALAYHGDQDRPGRRQISDGGLRVLTALKEHPLQDGASFAVLPTNPILFVYSDSTAAAPGRLAIVGPWNGMYGQREEFLKPDAFSVTIPPHRQ